MGRSASLHPDRLRTIYCLNTHSTKVSASIGYNHLGLQFQGVFGRAVWTPSTVMCIVRLFKKG